MIDTKALREAFEASRDMEPQSLIECADEIDRLRAELETMEAWPNMKLEIDRLGAEVERVSALADTNLALAERAVSTGAMARALMAEEAARHIESELSRRVVQRANTIGYRYAASIRSLAPLPSGLVAVERNLLATIDALCAEFQDNHASGSEICHKIRAALKEPTK